MICLRSSRELRASSAAHFEGGHPDHDICRVALGLASNAQDYRVRIFEYGSYNHCGYKVFVNASVSAISVVATDSEEILQQHVVVKCKGTMQNRSSIIFGRLQACYGIG